MSEPAPEQLKGTIAGQQFSVTTSNLVPILLIALIGLAGYISYQQQANGLKLLHAEHEQIKTLLSEQNALRTTQFHTLGQMLVTLDWNSQRPANDRLPLELSPDLVPWSPDRR